MGNLKQEPLLTPGEVAALLRVDPKTVTQWARAGKLRAIRLPSGHRRYREEDVRELLTQGSEGVASEQVSRTDASAVDSGILG